VTNTAHICVSKLPALKYNCHRVPTRESESVPTTENTQLNRITIEIPRTGDRWQYECSFGKFAWHKQGSAPDIGLLTDRYEISFMNQIIIVYVTEF